MAINDDDLRQLIYRSCLTLDAEDFDGYLNLYAPKCGYKITAYSPEIRKEMTWLDLDRDRMVALFNKIPEHTRLPGTFLRQANVYTIERKKEKEREHAFATTLVTVYYTTPEGSTRVFAVGKYYDEIDVTNKGPLLTSRHVKLETRDVGKGSHLPM